LPEPKPKIRYHYGNEELLDEVVLLWEALNKYLLHASKNFKQHYQKMTFEKRKVALLDKAENGKMRVDIVIDELSGQKVGYCVSSVTKLKEGEIQSIYVDVNHQGFGVGDALIRKALTWMEEEGAESKIVEVSFGNENAFGFYAKYGFLPRKTVLTQIKSVCE
jgi:ribosomal protein S18 acetylase RimI-like enzyme